MHYVFTYFSFHVSVLVCLNTLHGLYRVRVRVSVWVRIHYYHHHPLSCSVAHKAETKDRQPILSWTSLSISKSVSPATWSSASNICLQHSSSSTSLSVFWGVYCTVCLGLLLVSILKTWLVHLQLYVLIYVIYTCYLSYPSIRHSVFPCNPQKSA